MYEAPWEPRAPCSAFDQLRPDSFLLASLMDIDPPSGWVISMLIVTVISAVLFLALIIPVQGVVTRFRINYTPKGVGLGEGGDEQVLSQDMRVGPVVNSVRIHDTQARSRTGEIQ